MIAKLIGGMSLGAGIFMGVTVARADHNLPIEYHQGINSFGLPAGEVYEDYFPTEVLPNHGKVMFFSAVFGNFDQSSRDANVVVWLDWLDPRFPGVPQTTPPESFIVPPGGAPFEYFTPIHFIPFCPPELSIHIQNDGPGGPISFSGAVTHITSGIPEPSALALSVIGLASVTAVQRTGRSK